jgi:paraquat-inducible protein B
MNTPTPMAEPPASVPEALVHTRWHSRVSLVWIVPVVAALIGGGIAVRAVLESGPTIRIRFQTAEGIEAGKTKIRYRNVEVGEVRAVTLAPDHHSVVAQADMVKGSDSLLARDTRFWVVVPRIGAGGVSGLGTLLSGPYVGMDIGHADQRSKTFRGLESPPVIASDQPGREYVLRGDTVGSVAAGSPVYFRHVRVGEITHSELDSDGRGVTVDVFVQSPYDRFVTADTRFWHASGVDVALGSGGLRVETESVATILMGGVSFETPLDSTNQPPIAANHSFRLAANREMAMRSPNERPVPYLMYFKGSLRGLSVGSPVEINGIEVGEVSAVSLEYDSAHVSYRYPVEVNVYPQRIWAHYRPGTERPEVDRFGVYQDVDRSGVYQFVERLIEHGLRAQLRTGSLLTGQQFVALDFFPRAPRATSDPSKSPMEVPTVSGGLDELTGALTDIAAKVNALPLERIAAHTDETLLALRQTLDSTNQLVERLQTQVAPEITGTLDEVRRALGDADATLSSEGPLQLRLQQTLRQLTRAAEALRSLADTLERHPEALIRGKPKDGS